MDFIPGIGATAGGLDAQRTRLEVIAQNLANIHTTKTADGGPYQRQIVNFVEALDATGNPLLKFILSRVIPSPAQLDLIHHILMLMKTVRCKCQMSLCHTKWWIC